MAVNIGPKIGVDGEPEYRAKINNIIQQAKTLKSEMKLVSAEFDDNSSAQERAAAQSKVLERQVDVQRQRVAALNEMLEKSTKKYDENDDKTLQWKQAVYEATAELRKMERELNPLPESIDDVGEAMDDASDSTFKFGDALKAGTIIEAGKAIISTLIDIVEETKEYRKIMASLEVSSERAGYTAEETAASYRLLYGVLGDDQSSATALANLQALQLDQSDLTTLITGTIGAWAAYGDSIPIDSLAEAINETIKVGKVTGTFADVLNWAGTSEDDFNVKLAETEDVAERTNIVLTELANQGLVEVGEAWQQNNRSIVDANNATNDLNQAYARIAEMVAPAINAGQQAIADLLNTTLDWIDQNSGAVDKFVESAGVLEQAAVENAEVVNETYLNLGESLAQIIADVMESNHELEVSNSETMQSMGESYFETVADIMDSLATLEQAQADNVQAMNNSLAEFESFLNQTVLKSIASVAELEAETATQSASISNYFAEMVPDALEKLVSMMDAAAERFSSAWDEASVAAASNAQSVSSSTSAMAANVKNQLDALSGESPGWGSDMAQGFANGVQSKVSTVVSAVSSLASRVRSYLHFSVPDEGPLADADEYGPDFMKLISKGITDNIGLVSDAVEQAANAMVIQPQSLSQGNTSNTVNRFGGISINIYGEVGQDVSELADAVMDRLQTVVEQKEVAFNG